MTVSKALKKIWLYLSKRNRYQIVILLFMMIFSGVFELASIGAVVPFISILLSPETLLKYPVVNQAFNTIGLQGSQEIIIFLTAIFLGSITISALLRSMLLWLNLRISHSIGGNFENEIFWRVLHQPYEAHVQMNTSDVIAGVQKGSSIITAITAALGLVHGSVLVTSILIAVVAVDTYITLGVFFVLAFIYLATMYFSRIRLKRNGEVIARYANVQFKMMQESLGGIRDILLGGRQQQYSNYMKEVIFKIKNSSKSNLLIGQGPRLVIEPVSIFAIVAVASYTALLGDFTEKIPIFVAFTFAAQRLLPIAQNIYSGWSSLNAALPQIIDVFDFLDLPVREEEQFALLSPIKFKKSLRFENVSFRYQGTSEDVIQNVSIEILQGSCVGIVGRTGSGKSTVLDLLLGLLVPTTGIIKLDGKPMKGKLLQKWQRAVAYVPQDTFFPDTTIAENIAFGEERNEIDLARLQDAVSRAQLKDFIAELPRGIDTVIGEDGRMLSGGQRQRIGVARALYKKSAILILDEATSALDTWTERAMIDEVAKDDITLIIVSHRLSTLQTCDMVYVLEDGRMTSSGSYLDFLKSKYHTSLQL